MIQFNLYVVKFERNHYIQDIETYLSNCEKLYNEYNKTINRDFLEDKSSLTLKMTTDDVSKKLKGFNYLRMKDEDTGRLRYYFIDNMKYLNDGTTQVFATLDVVNSFQSYIDKTSNFNQVKMTRRHKDRFDQQGSRIFDKTDEGFGEVSVAGITKTVPTSKASNIIYLQPTTTSDNTTINSTALIRRMWCPKSESAITCKQYKYSLNKDVFYNSDGTIKWTQKMSRMFFFSNNKNYGLTVRVNKRDSKEKVMYADAVLVYLDQYTIASSIPLVFTLFSFDRGSYTVVKQYTVNGYECDKTNPDDISIYFNSVYGRVDNDINSIGTIPDLSIGNVYYHYELAAGSETSVVAASKSISVQPLSFYNLRDSQLKQVIEIPFMPNTNDLVCVNDTFPYEIEFADAIDTTSLSSQKISIPSAWENVTVPDANTYKDKIYESKLYGSQCQSYYLTYDNNTMVLQPEYREGQDHYMLFKSIVPLNMSNNIAFNIDGFVNRKPFDNWLICSRNNNVAIYSNEYLNYIRTGYNYDVKNKQQQSIKNWVSFGVGIASAGASIAGGVLSRNKSAGLGNYLLGSAVGSSLGTITSLTNNILAEQANEQALEQKKQQAMNATINVSGSDDLALFKEYSGNNLMFISTYPENDIQQALYNLFYEYGYADNTTYSTMPDYQTRAYFNYVQADIGHALPDDYIPTEHINEIIDAFRNGITFEWHGDRGWKLDNEAYENYELL